jgi:hypothetical protein
MREQFEPNLATDAMSAGDRSEGNDLFHEFQSAYLAFFFFGFSPSSASTASAAPSAGSAVDSP